MNVEVKSYLQSFENIKKMVKLLYLHGNKKNILPYYAVLPEIDKNCLL